MYPTFLDFLWHHFWNRPCSALRGEKPRSPKWPACRRAYLAQHPFCEVTGARNPNVHHVIPFSRNADLELDATNLIGLRRDVHLLIGHLDNWQSYNVLVRTDAANLRYKIAARPNV